ncbi:MAG: prolyl oligopeptidase family serine peptidase [Candidatus Altiarchaeota archaeon]|nr:prolyl oligopeptidase family serine peptidase [Candidatus Altiarchaeota archaeon]
MINKKTPFIEWKPVISPDDVFSDVVGLGEIQVEEGNVYWLEMRPAEKGRYVLVGRDAGGGIRDITPPGFNVRTRVHEYGGGAYTVFGNSIYFVNFRDQRIYHQLGDSREAHPLTPRKNQDGSLGKYASLTVSPGGEKLLFVYEKEYDSRENRNFLGVLDLNSGHVSEPEIIAEGCDFYADPVFSPSGEKVAWLQWDHPNMPWDSTELMIGEFRENTLSDVRRVDGGRDRSICFPRFDGEGRLYYVMDGVAGDTSSPMNWWNLYCYTSEIDQITAERAEFGEPHWVFGQSNYDFLPDNGIIAKMVRDGTACLVVVDPEKRSLSPVGNDLSSYRSIRTDNEGRVFFIGASSRKTAAVCSLDVGSGKVSVLKKSARIELRGRDISLPASITYPTRDGRHAHAFLYMPKNSRFSAPADEKPPLLVMAHGGPTGRAGDSFSFITQFWTSSGFAVVDVNYRGSAGYGRRYRDALLSLWGVIDAGDVADAIRYLVKEKRVDPLRVAVRGGSAGGYMVQRVMTLYPDLFRAGASYFGIGDLITLVEQTHKFESRYIGNLVGARLPEGGREYRDRSPINHLDRLNAPLIIFQGSDDRIVTPDCSREVAQVLEKRGIRYEYIEYKGEAHGFRTKKSNVDSLDKEFAFYREIFSENINLKQGGG